MKQKEILCEVAGFALACIITFSLKEAFQLSAVVASASVGLTGSFILHWFGDDYKGTHAAIYCGSFAGMCSAEILHHEGHLLLLIGIGSLVYLVARNRFAGIGGKLGGISFISVLIFLLFREVLI